MSQNNLFKQTTPTISGSVSNFASLPVAASHTGELWFVSTASGGIFGMFYKYPKGLYTPNEAEDGWELVPVNVRLSEDSSTLVNITDWAQFQGFAIDISAGDRIVFSGVSYENITGNIGSAPNSDTTNWRPLSQSTTDIAQLKAISKTDQPISTLAAGTVPVAEITQESSQVVISNGEIEFQKAAFYRAQIQLDIDNQANTKIETWAEFFNGSTWEPLDDSGGFIETGQANEGNFIFESTFTVPAGFKLRFKLRVTAGTASLNTVTLANGIAVPSVTFIVYEVPVIR